MAESENDVDQGPPGVQTQVRADQYDMRDDYDDDDQEQRDQCDKGTGYLPRFLRSRKVTFRR